MEPARTTGRSPKPVEYELIGPLTAVDMSLLDEEKGVKPSAVKRLSERHHALARHIAGGATMSEAAAICGYNLSRVSILKDDPAFKELVQFYSKNLDDIYMGQHEALAQLSKTATAIAMDRLEEDPDKIKFDQLLETIKLASDRTGFGPASSSTQVNVHVGLGAKLEEARKRIAARTIEHQPIPKEAAE